MALNINITPYTHINWKWIIDINGEFFRRYHRRISLWPRYIKEFVAMTLKIHLKSVELNLTKLKTSDYQIHH